MYKILHKGVEKMMFITGVLILIVGYFLGAVTILWFENQKDKPRLSESERAFATSPIQRNGVKPPASTPKPNQLESGGVVDKPRDEFLKYGEQVLRKRYSEQRADTDERECFECMGTGFYSFIDNEPCRRCKGARVI